MAWTTADYGTGPIKNALDHFLTDSNELQRLEKDLMELENKRNSARAALLEARKQLTPRLERDKVYVIGTYALSLKGERGTDRYIDITKAELF